MRYWLNIIGDMADNGFNSGSKGGKGDKEKLLQRINVIGSNGD
jgi:hypothetical protein